MHTYPSGVFPNFIEGENISVSPLTGTFILITNNKNTVLY